GGKGITPNREVIAYCRIGERSAHTWFVLHELLGYPDVRNYDGSWTEWGSSIRVPIEKEGRDGSSRIADRRPLGPQGQPDGHRRDGARRRRRKHLLQARGPVAAAPRDRAAARHVRAAAGVVQ